MNSEENLYTNVRLEGVNNLSSFWNIRSLTYMYGEALLKMNIEFASIFIPVLHYSLHQN